MQFTRRRFLKRTLGATAACGLARLGVAKDVASPDKIIDTHVYLGHWPHRELVSEKPTELISTLRKNNVSQAWVGSLDGLFHKDIAGVNERLADTCSRLGGEMLIPFGTINPTLPDWEDDIRRCHETFHMRGIRLHPNYHGYTLDEPRFGRLLELAAERNLIVQIVAWIENERHLFLNPHAAEVDLKPLAEKVDPLRQLRLVVANGFGGADQEQIRVLLPMKQIYFDVGRAGNSADIRDVVDKASSERVVFGSCAPLNDFESARVKLRRAELANGVRRAIAMKNAKQLIAAEL